MHPFVLDMNLNYMFLFQRARREPQRHETWSCLTMQKLKVFATSIHPTHSFVLDMNLNNKNNGMQRRFIFTIEVISMISMRHARLDDLDDLDDIC